MNKHNYFMMLITGMLIMSCTETKEGIFYSDKEINWVLVNNILDSHTEGDPFEIVSLKVESGKLLLKVNYSGGCKAHDFSLVWNGECNSMNSEQSSSFAIIHNANGDLCKSWVTDNVVIDYHSIVRKKFSIEKCTEAFFINGSNSIPYFVRPDARNMTQGKECLYEVELMPVDCATGFLGDLWFKSTDASLLVERDSFYFQPTNITVDDVFETGKYKIGVRIEIGFYAGEVDPCPVFPVSGLPVDILCIERID